MWPAEEPPAFTPVIDRTFPFERMAEAHAYAESGAKLGNIVVTVG